MKLNVNCKACRNKIELNDSVSDRAELARIRGVEFLLSCGQCLEEHKYHLNDVRAVESKVIALIALFVFIFGTGIIGYLLRNQLIRSHGPYNALAIGGMLLIPSVVYMVMTKQERDTVNRFNSYWA